MSWLSGPLRDNPISRWLGVDSSQQQQFQNDATEMTKVYKNKDFTDQVQEQANSRTRYRGDGSCPAPISYYPQELFTSSQPNGIHFFINARSNSAAAISQHKANPDALIVNQSKYKNINDFTPSKDFIYNKQNVDNLEQSIKDLLDD